MIAPIAGTRARPMTNEEAGEAMGMAIATEDVARLGRAAATMVAAPKTRDSMIS